MYINLGDTHIEMSVQASVIFVIGVIILISLMCVGVAKAIAREKWVCPKCYTVFNVNWKQAFPGLHYGDDVKLRCPKCKKKYYCSESHQK